MSLRCNDLEYVKLTS